MYKVCDILDMNINLRESTGCFHNTWKKLDTRVILSGNGTWVALITNISILIVITNTMVTIMTISIAMSGYCNSSYLPHNRGFHSFFGQWSHVVDYYTRWEAISLYLFLFLFPSFFCIQNMANEYFQDGSRERRGR